jgi:thiol-disulfide isomerase/thioredoxin
MKNYILLTFLLTQGVTFGGYSQEISGKVQGRVYDSENKDIYYIEPLEGKYFESNLKKAALSSAGLFQIEIYSSKPAFIYFFSPGNFDLLHMVFYKPGMKSTMNFRDNKILGFKGDYTTENEFLSGLQRSYSHSPNLTFINSLVKNKTPANAYEEWSQYFENETANLENYFNDTHCDNDLQEFLLVDHKAFLVNSFITYIIKQSPVGFSQLTRSQMDDSQKMEVNTYVADWGNILEKVFSHLSLDKNAYYSKDYNVYVDNYIGWYLLRFRGINQPSNFVDLVDWHYNYSPKFESHLPPEAQEAWLARHLQFLRGLGSIAYDVGFINLQNYFRNKYPESAYLDHLNNFSIDVYKYLNSPASLNDYKIFLSSQYETLESLYENIENKFIYVDLWATWCKPCIEEFQFYPNLRNQLKTDSVEFLFISVDDSASRQKWQEMVHRFELNGVHIMANSNLRAYIWNKIIKEKTEAYPRYLLIAPDGKIMDANAPPPGNAEKLIQLIK